MFSKDTTALVVPVAPQGISNVLDMTRVYEAETRIREVATVNSHKAPELLAFFNQAWLDLDEHCKRLSLCLYEAEKVSKGIRARILLDEVPEILAKKGLATSKNPSGSADQREAVLDASAEYQKALDDQQLVKCMLELLKGKQEAVEMAYTSIKKILGGEPSYGGGAANPSRQTSVGELPEGMSPGQVVQGRTHPKYGRAY